MPRLFCLVIFFISCSLPPVRPLSKTQPDKMIRPAKKIKPIWTPDQWVSVQRKLGLCEQKGFSSPCAVQKRIFPTDRLINQLHPQCPGEIGHRNYDPDIQDYGGFISDTASTAGSFIAPQAVVCGRVFLAPDSLVLDSVVIKGPKSFKSRKIWMKKTIRRTPLLTALLSRKIKQVEKYLNKNHDPYKRDQNGLNIFQLAKKINDVEMIDFLEKWKKEREFKFKI